jgi:hypothetical protein
MSKITRKKQYADLMAMDGARIRDLNLASKVDLVGATVGPMVAKAGKIAVSGSGGVILSLGLLGCPDNPKKEMKAKCDCKGDKVHYDACDPSDCTADAKGVFPCDCKDPEVSTQQKQIDGLFDGGRTAKVKVNYLTSDWNNVADDVKISLNRVYYSGTGGQMMTIDYAFDSANFGDVGVTIIVENFTGHYRTAEGERRTLYLSVGGLSTLNVETLVAALTSMYWGEASQAKAVPPKKYNVGEAERTFAQGKAYQRVVGGKVFNLSMPSRS